MKRLAILRMMNFVCLISFGVESCTANAPVPPTESPTLVPSLTATSTPTETPVPPTLTPPPPSELSKEDFNSNINELTNTEMITEWERLMVAFPEAEIYMTARGEICIYNTKDLLACGQVIRGSSGSTFTYLITPVIPWEIGIYMKQTEQDNVEALNTIQIPDMVNNAKKDEIIRIMETLLDLKEGTISTKEDLANYKSVQPPRHLIAIFSGLEEESTIISIFAKDLLINYEGYEIYVKNPNTAAGQNNRPFWNLGHGSSIKSKFSRIVKADDAIYIYAHFESGLKDAQEFAGSSVKNLLGWQIINRTFQQLIREYLKQRGELTPQTFGLPISSKKFEHIFDNYPPLSTKYWELAASDGNISAEEEEAGDFYVTNIIRVQAESFTQVP